MHPLLALCCYIGAVCGGFALCHIRQVKRRLIQHEHRTGHILQRRRERRLLAQQRHARQTGFQFN